MDEWRLFGADPARTHTGIVYQPASPARRELFGKEEKAPTGRRWIDRFLWKSRKPSIRVTSSGESCDSLFLLFFLYDADGQCCRIHFHPLQPVFGTNETPAQAYLGKTGAQEKHVRLMSHEVNTGFNAVRKRSWGSKRYTGMQIH